MIGQDEVLRELPLLLRRLLLEDVAREGVASLDLALGGQLEALLGARMGLHLRHNGTDHDDRTGMAARSDPGRRVARVATQTVSTRLVGREAELRSLTDALD